MKKALSLFLAVLMIFATLSVGASAQETAPSPWHEPAGPVKSDQVVLLFDPEGGTFVGTLPVYDVDTKKTEYKTGYTDDWAMIPLDASSMKEETLVLLPNVTPAPGFVFKGWECIAITPSTVTDESIDIFGKTYKPDTVFVIPKGTAGSVIQFHAIMTSAAEEETPLVKVISILTKVYGTIIGILFFKDVKKGIEYMENLFGGILGKF